MPFEQVAVLRSTAGAYFKVGPLGETATTVSFEWEMLGSSGTDAERESGVPRAFTLDQNYPNPFNPSTTIRFTLNHAAHARLGVFDLLGRRVLEVADGMYPAGSHEVSFDGTGLRTGVYAYVLAADGLSESRQMVLLR